MNILGVILWLLMPVFIGLIAKNILRWKEMSQIETYLTGFFLLFLLQGIIFVPMVFLKQPFLTAEIAVIIVFGILMLVSLILTLIQFRKSKSLGESRIKTPLSKREKIYFCITLLTFVWVILRMTGSVDILREDITLETVKTTVATNTMFQYHPLTGNMMEAGLIQSKKIITLPLLYSAVVDFFRMDAMTFLYVVVGAGTYIASVFSASLVYKKMTAVNRKKLYIFMFIYNLLVLSGDYHHVTLCSHLLYQGYLGETICFAVILPYLLYVVLDWYQSEGGEEHPTNAKRIQFVMRLLIPLCISVFLTGLGTGFVLLVICLLIAAACCLIRSLKEVKACKE